MTGNSPSSRWTKEHGYGTPGSARRRKRRMKVAYRSWWHARWVAFLINRRRHNEPDEKVITYACEWGDDYRSGQTARRHWHNGRAPRDDMWGY